MGGRMIATLNTNGDICAIQKAGRVGIMHTVIMQCLRIASVKAGDITSKIKNAVSFSFVWLFVGHCVWYHVINSSNYTTYLSTTYKTGASYCFSTNGWSRKKCTFLLSEFYKDRSCCHQVLLYDRCLTLVCIYLMRPR